MLGCAHDPRPPPVQGWRELRSAHFRLRTDLPEADARTTLEKLETLRWWLQSAWSTGGDSPGTSNAIVLDQPAELRTFAPMPGIATTARDGPLLVTAGTETLFGDRSPWVQVLAHEVAHELIRRRMPGAPRWFHEGLAGYLQTVVALDDHRVRFGFGATDASEGQGSLTSPALQIPRNLLSLDETASRSWETAPEDALSDLYLSARLWVSLLRTEEPVRMRALEVALASGTPWRLAWADLRRGLDVGPLYEKLWRLVQARGWTTELRVFAPLPPGIGRPRGERLLAPWEVHLTLADLWVMAGRIRSGESLGGQVRAEIEAAVAAAPGEPVALVRLAELEREPDLRRGQAEALVQRFPSSAEARVFLARLLRDEGGPVEGRREAALAAVTAAPDSVDALTAYAVEELRAGNASGAVRSLVRAEQLEPWNPGVFVARAVVLGAIGRCEQAIDSLRRALDVLPDDPPPADVHTLLQERERISRTCRPRTAP
jgi:tetratricopeptide (TPR) repeat protein